MLHRFKKYLKKLTRKEYCLSLTIRAICTPGDVCCSLLKSPTTTTTTTAAAIIIQTPSPISMCGMPNPLGAMPKILGDATTTTTVFGEFPWMVAILDKTDTGLRYTPHLR